VFRTLAHTPKVGRVLLLGLVLACGQPVLAYGQFAKSPVFCIFALQNRPFYACFLIKRRSGMFVALGGKDHYAACLSSLSHCFRYFSKGTPRHPVSR